MSLSPSDVNPHVKTRPVDYISMARTVGALFLMAPAVYYMVKVRITHVWAAAGR